MKIVFVDIDGTICKTDGTDYAGAIPMKDKIAVVNDWYKRGNYVVYYTARGSLTGTDWRPLTEKQLKEWGCKYHELRLDKPLYDVMFDDRTYRAIPTIGELDD